MTNFRSLISKKKIRLIKIIKNVRKGSEVLSRCISAQFRVREASSWVFSDVKWVRFGAA